MLAPGDVEPRADERPARPGPTRAAERRSSRRFLTFVCLAVVTVRATYVVQPLRNDEGGYLRIARQWHTGGEFLYGDYFVDRPPLLMAIFRIAAVFEWDQAIRVIAIAFVLVFVLAAWYAGKVLAGPAGGRWAAVVAAGLMCSPMLAADQADGELFGAALVMAAIAAGLAAWRADASPRRLSLAGCAGALGAAAPLVKQNLLEGLLFVAALVAVRWVARAGSRRREGAIALGVALGAVFTGALFCAWAALAGAEWSGVWHDLVTFRREALNVIWSIRPQASIRRAMLLVALGLVTGVLPVVVTWFVGAGWRAPVPRTPESAAIAVILVFGLAAIVSGGSYWPPYLLQLAPAVVLAAAVVAPTVTVGGRWMRVFGGMIVASAVVGSSVAGIVYATVPRAWFSERTGEWLGDSKAATDTALVAYGWASVLERADMHSPYPHLWSVPMRTLDPEQARLRATLAGPQAPAWIVQVNSFNAWNIDRESRLRNLVRERYRVVADVCGHRVWLRRDLTRELVPPPKC